MDKFEKLIKNAVEGYEAPYNPQAWENVSQGLTQAKPLKWIIGGAAAAIVIATTVIAINYSGEEVVGNEVADNNSIEVLADNTDETADLLVNNNDDVADDAVETNTELQEESNGSDVSESGAEVLEENRSSEEGISNVPETNETTNTASDNQHVITIPTDNGSSVTPEVTEKIVKTYNSDFTITQNSVCEDENVICIVNQIDPELIYVWEFGDGTVASGHSVTHKFSEAGNYKVTLSLKDKRTNKTLSQNSNKVEIMAMPKVDFAWEKTSKVVPTVKFINLTENAESFMWNIKGIQSSSQNEFEYTFRNQGIYAVSMTATGSNGCVKTLSKSLSIEEDYNLLAPTAFSPNGDFKNDFFIPEALKIMEAEFIMTIYDENGGMVYETRNVNEPWDGRMNQDNSPAPDGGYVWMVKVRNAQGDFDTYNGQVFITR